VECDGDPAGVRRSPAVGNLIVYPRWVEAELAPGADADRLLADLVGRVSVKRFEVVAPSLQKSFISRVGSRGEGR